MDWKKTLPFIGALATGNIPGLVSAAASAIGDALGLPVEPTPAAIDKALSSATPEQMAALKSIDADLKIKMRGFDVEEKRIEVDNTKDARAMQVATRSYTPDILAILIVTGFFSILTAMLMGKLKLDDNQSLLILLGALSAGFGSVLNYFFGSSNGSQAKDRLLLNSTQIK